MVKEQEVGSRWRAIDWDKVMGPERARADHFMRSGLIRKDLLPRFAGKHSPPTFVASTVAQLDALLETPGADDDERPGCLNPRAILAESTNHRTTFCSLVGLLPPLEAKADGMPAAAAAAAPADDGGASAAGQPETDDAQDIAADAGDEAEAIREEGERADEGVEREQDDRDLARVDEQGLGLLAACGCRGEQKQRRTEAGSE